MEESYSKSSVSTTARQSYFLATLICGLAALFYVYDYFIQVAPSVFTQDLMRTFGIDSAGLGVLSACFFYSYTLMQIPAGLLIDRFGARLLLTFAVLISAVGVTIFGYTSSFWMAGTGRFLIGFGSSFAFISALFLIARWFPHRHFVTMAGMVQFAGSVGSLIGLAPFASMINTMGWRKAMIITGIFTFVMAFLFWFVIRDGKSIEPKSKSHLISNEWHRLRVILGNAQVWWIGVCGFMSWVPVAAVGALWGVPYLMKIYGWSNTTAGEWCSLFWIGLALGSPLMGWWQMRQKRRLPSLYWCFLIGIISAFLLVFAPTLSPIWLGLALFGLGWSSSVQSLSFGCLKDSLPAAAFGTASGFNNMAAILGGGLAQTSIGYMLRWMWGGAHLDGIPVYTIGNYQMAFAILPIAAVIGFIVSLFLLRETYCKDFEA